MLSHTVQHIIHPAEIDTAGRSSSSETGSSRRWHLIHLVNDSQVICYASLLGCVGSANIAIQPWHP